jgi:hypothetical protein
MGRFIKNLAYGIITNGKMVFAKLIFFPPNFFWSERFFFSKKKKFGGKKST